jgi:predicted metal-binding membrane protein
MTRTTTTAAALAATLGLAVAAWVVAVREMNGMDMGVATDLGSFASFLAVWVSMMAAMMLPGAAPAIARRARAAGRAVVAPFYAGSYLAIWAVVGLVVYALYQPHGTASAAVLTVAVGVYELTPFKHLCRRRCRENVRSGFRFGVYCVGSSIGLMVMLVALGVMSVTWMAVVAIVVFGQKLLAPRRPVDTALALAIIGLGVLIAVEPSLVPGLEQM